MADPSKESLPVSGSELPPIKVAEVGFNGLKVIAGQVQEEADMALRWPQSIYTYKKMLKDSTVSSAVEYVQTRIASVTWVPEAPKGYEKELEQYVNYLKTVQDDMEQSFLSYIKQLSSFVTYGFSIAEIVPRTRLYSNGSKYNDGLRGIKKLAFRSQDTISGVEYKNNGRDFVGYWQRINQITNKRGYEAPPVVADPFQEVLLRKEKLLIFRNSPLKDSPFGSSPLNNIFEAYRYKKEYEQTLAYGVSADIQGLKVLYIPPQYLDEKADASEKAVFEQYKKIMRNMHIGAESGIILPQVLDDKGEQYFKFEVVNIGGKKAFDVPKIIENYKMEILTALYATVLTAGQGGGGSFALSTSLQEMVDMIIEAKLEEMRDVFNHTLVPYLFKLNGWDMAVMPVFKWKVNPLTITPTTLDDFSKAIQRIGAVKLISRTARNVNAIAERLGLVDMIPEDATQEEIDTFLGSPPDPTKAASGMQDGLNSGTGSANGSSGDGSISNSENK